MKPWGRLNWMLDCYPNRAWTVVFGVSFERRSATLIEHLSSRSDCLKRAVGIRVDDPISDYTPRINALTDYHEAILSGVTSLIEHLRFDLLTPAKEWDELTNDFCLHPDTSVILDLTSLPKRISLFIFKRLLANPNLKDLLVCYTKAESYTEEQLARDVLPPGALPGYGFESTENQEKNVIVSVGYSAFDLREILQQTSTQDLFFLMPFPPASPSFRRSWKFLTILNDRLNIRQPTVERVNAFDAFGALAWIEGLMEPGKSTTMLPLGPKPHSLGMALAQIRSPGTAELVYPQPQRYHPDYSLGVGLDPKGNPSIIGYGIRRDYKNVLEIPSGH